MKNKILVLLLLTCITITALCACGAVVAQTSTEYSADLYTDSDFQLNADGSLSDVTIRQFANQVKSQEHLSVVYDLDKVIPPQYLQTQEDDVILYHYGIGLTSSRHAMTVLLNTAEYS